MVANSETEDRQPCGVAGPVDEVVSFRALRKVMRRVVQFYGYERSGVRVLRSQSRKSMRLAFTLFQYRK